MTTTITKYKEVSIRRMKPTEPIIDLTLVFQYAHNWNAEWETDGSVHVFDEGIAQYLLCGKESHHKFYASLVLNKPCLRCSVVLEEPEDDLDDVGNRFRMIGDTTCQQDIESTQILKEHLAKRGYKFD